MTVFTFPAWYARMGYAGYRGGVRDCALDLGVTREHVRRLRRGEGESSATLVKLCQSIERQKDQAAFLQSAEIVVTDDAGRPKHIMVGGKVIKTVVDATTGEEHTLATDYVLTKPR